MDRITLVVDDRGARYPLTIDPLLTATADTQLESNQSSSTLGTGVAGVGDVNGDGAPDVIVGADLYDNGQNNEGAAFVYLPEPSQPVMLLTGLAFLLLVGRRRIWARR